MSDVLMEEPLIPYTGHYLPLKAKSKRQGKRKKDRWAPCRHCGTSAVLRCFRCKHWLCRDCVRLRKAPRAPLGTYHAICHPKCVLRKNKTTEEEMSESEKKWDALEYELAERETDHE